MEVPAAGEPCARTAAGAPPWLHAESGPGAHHRISFRSAEYRGISLARGAAAADAVVEPGAGVAPVAGDGYAGDVQDGGDLRLRQAGEEAELDNFGLGPVFT